MIGLTLGQQSWLRLLNIEHHQVMAGTAASMAPGYERCQQAADDQGAAGLLGEIEGQVGKRRLTFGTAARAPAIDQPARGRM